MTTIKQWHENRRPRITSRIKRWITNPFGTLVRLIEIISIGFPVISVLKTKESFGEISHMNPEISLNVKLGYIKVDKAKIELQRNLMLLRSGHILTLRFSYQSFLSGTNFRSLRIVKQKFRATHSNCIPLYQQDYYFHFLLEEVPEILRILKIYPTFFVITNEKQPEFVFEILDYYGIVYKKTKQKVIMVTNSILPTYPEIYGEWSVDLLTSSAPPVESQPSLNLLLLRKGLDREDRFLEDSLIECLSPLGFKVIDPSDMGFAQQVATFTKAGKIVGIHGGALSNIVFSPQGTKVFEIFSHVYRSNCFEELAKAKNISYESSDSEEVIEKLKVWLYS